MNDKSVPFDAFYNIFAVNIKFMLNPDTFFNLFHFQSFIIDQTGSLIDYVNILEDVTFH